MPSPCLRVVAVRTTRNGFVALNDVHHESGPMPFRASFLSLCHARRCPGRKWRGSGFWSAWGWDFRGVLPAKRNGNQGAGACNAQ